MHNIILGLYLLVLMNNILIFSKTYAEEPVASSPTPVQLEKKSKKLNRQPLCVGDVSLLTDLEKKQNELDLKTKITEQS